MYLSDTEIAFSTRILAALHLARMFMGHRAKGEGMIILRDT